MKKADRIYLATDPDREGEAISWHLAKMLKLDENEKELLEHCIVQMENETGLDRNAALADICLLYTSPSPRD